MAALGGAALLIYGGILIRRGELTPALFAVFLTTLVLLYDPIRKLNKVNLLLQGALAAAGRVFDLLATPFAIQDPADPRPLQEMRTGVEFDRVSFGYSDAYVLEDFSLSIPRGKRIALVGHSGAGKSTVANLLPRFFDPAQGAVRIDGIDIRELSLKDLRSLIGLVPQDTVLFNDTVRNNLAYGHDEVALDRVREAAVAAYADEFILAMPNGYETVIGELGAQLSGGERQRLAIARALFKDAPILILDEATSQLDTESENEVQKALRNLMRGRTTLVIAHRISTIVSADEIVVMEHGSIVEQGSHEDLLERGGVYRRLYDLQFKV
jgi:subfamily B ATP-binding cassette protein MsbA